MSSEDGSAANHPGLSALAAAAAGVPAPVKEAAAPAPEAPRQRRAGGRADASSATLEHLDQACWGAQLRGDASLCTPGFAGGTAHFKNKFCQACKTGSFEIPVAHLRALPRSWNPDTSALDLKLSLSNGHSVGFWKTLPDGEGRFRFVNNTLDCAGPQLVVFRELPSPMLTWAALPERWVEQGVVTLQVAKGTLVPRVSMTAIEPELWRNGGGRASLAIGGEGRVSSARHAPVPHGPNPRPKPDPPPRSRHRAAAPPPAAPFPPQLDYN